MGAGLTFDKKFGEDVPALSKVEIFSILFLILFSLFLLLYRQPVHPAPWFDEGLNASTSRMIAERGLYALPDAGGPRLFDPAIQTGPTVLLPIALMMKLFGNGVLQARLVIVAYSLAALVAYLLIARKLVGNPYYLLAGLLLILGSGVEFSSFIYMGRQVLGEVPALAFYLIGLYIWWKTYEGKLPVVTGYLISGFSWGLAMVTKSQVLFLTAVTLIVITLLGKYYYRKTGWKDFFLPGSIAAIIVISWYGIKLLSVGSSQASTNFNELSTGFFQLIFSLNTHHWLNALKTIKASYWWLWGLPAIVWGVYQARQRTKTGFMHMTALVFPILSIVWFALLSIGWDRYGFYGIVLTPIWTAGLIAFLWEKAKTGRYQFWIRSSQNLFLLAVLVISGNGLVTTFSKPTDQGYFQMQAYLQEHIPEDALIVSAEWQISITAQQPIAHPPISLINELTYHFYSGVPLPENKYDPLEYNPDYLLVGTFGAWTRLYQDLIEAPFTEEVVVMDSYVLYKINR